MVIGLGVFWGSFKSVVVWIFGVFLFGVLFFGFIFVHCLPEKGLLKRMFRYVKQLKLCRGSSGLEEAVFDLSTKGL